MKLKNIVFILFFLAVTPLLLLFYIFRYFIDENSILAAYSQLLSLIPGKFGSFSRVALLSHLMQFCDREVYIGFCTIFSQIDTIISKGVYIGSQCNLGMCSIGKDTLIGSGVHIMSGKNQHNFSDLSLPIRLQGGTLEQIKIGEDCWIGNGSIIMANIGNKCIVGAGSVVIKNVPDYSIVVGNPAKVIKSRLD